MEGQPADVPRSQPAQARLPDASAGRGPQWIASLERAAALGARVLFDGHGLVVHSDAAVRQALDAKRRFLESVRDRTRHEATHARTLPELTRRVFAATGPLDRLSRREGRLSLLTGSNFARSHLGSSLLSP